MIIYDVARRKKYEGEVSEKELVLAKA